MADTPGRKKKLSSRRRAPKQNPEESGGEAKRPPSTEASRRRRGGWGSVGEGNHRDMEEVEKRARGENLEVKQPEEESLQEETPRRWRGAGGEGPLQGSSEGEGHRGNLMVSEEGSGKEVGGRGGTEDLLRSEIPTGSADGSEGDSLKVTDGDHELRTSWNPETPEEETSEDVKKGLVVPGGSSAPHWEPFLLSSGAEAPKTPVVELLPAGAEPEVSHIELLEENELENLDDQEVRSVGTDLLGAETLMEIGTDSESVIDGDHELRTSWNPETPEEEPSEDLSEMDRCSSPAASWSRPEENLCSEKDGIKEGLEAKGSSSPAETTEEDIKTRTTWPPEEVLLTGSPPSDQDEGRIHEGGRSSDTLQTLNLDMRSPPGSSPEDDPENIREQSQVDFSSKRRRKLGSSRRSRRVAVDLKAPEGEGNTRSHGNPGTWSADVPDRDEVLSSREEEEEEQEDQKDGFSHLTQPDQVMQIPDEEHSDVGNIYQAQGGTSTARTWASSQEPDMEETTCEEEENIRSTTGGEQEVHEEGRRLFGVAGETLEKDLLSKKKKMGSTRRSRMRGEPEEDLYGFQDAEGPGYNVESDHKEATSTLDSMEAAEMFSTLSLMSEEQQDVHQLQPSPNTRTSVVEDAPPTHSEEELQVLQDPGGSSAPHWEPFLLPSGAEAPKTPVMELLPAGGEPEVSHIELLEENELENLDDPEEDSIGTDLLGAETLIEIGTDSESLKVTDGDHELRTFWIPETPEEEPSEVIKKGLEATGSSFEEDIKTRTTWSQEEVLLAGSPPSDQVEGRIQEGGRSSGTLQTLNPDMRSPPGSSPEDDPENIREQSQVDFSSKRRRKLGSSRRSRRVAVDLKAPEGEGNTRSHGNPGTWSADVPDRDEVLSSGEEVQEEQEEEEDQKDGFSHLTQPDQVMQIPHEEHSDVGNIYQAQGGTSTARTWASSQEPDMEETTCEEEENISTTGGEQEVHEEGRRLFGVAGETLEKDLLSKKKKMGSTRRSRMRREPEEDLDGLQDAEGPGCKPESDHKEATSTLDSMEASEMFSTLSLMSEEQQDVHQLQPSPNSRTSAVEDAPPTHSKEDLQVLQDPGGSSAPHWEPFLLSSGAEAPKTPVVELLPAGGEPEVSHIELLEENELENLDDQEEDLIRTDLLGAETLMEIRTDSESLKVTDGDHELRTSWNPETSEEEPSEDLSEMDRCSSPAASWSRPEENLCSEKDGIKEGLEAKGSSSPAETTEEDIKTRTTWPPEEVLLTGSPPSDQDEGRIHEGGRSSDTLQTLNLDMRSPPGSSPEDDPENIREQSQVDFSSKRRRKLGSSRRSRRVAVDLKAPEGEGNTRSHGNPGTWSADVLDRDDVLSSREEEQEQEEEKDQKDGFSPLTHPDQVLQMQIPDEEHSDVGNIYQAQGGTSTARTWAASQEPDMEETTCEEEENIRSTTGGEQEVHEEGRRLYNVAGETLEKDLLSKKKKMGSTRRSRMRREPEEDLDGLQDAEGPGCKPESDHKEAMSTLDSMEASEMFSTLSLMSEEQQDVHQLQPSPNSRTSAVEDAPLPHSEEELQVLQDPGGSSAPHWEPFLLSSGAEAPKTPVVELLPAGAEPEVSHIELLEENELENLDDQEEDLIGKDLLGAETLMEIRTDSESLKVTDGDHEPRTSWNPETPEEEPSEVIKKGLEAKGSSSEETTKTRTTWSPEEVLLTGSLPSDQDKGRIQEGGRSSDTLQTLNPDMRSPPGSSPEDDPENIREQSQVDFSSKRRRKLGSSRRSRRVAVDLKAPEGEGNTRSRGNPGTWSADVPDRDEVLSSREEEEKDQKDGFSQLTQPDQVLQMQIPDEENSDELENLESSGLALHPPSRRKKMGSTRMRARKEVQEAGGGPPDQNISRPKELTPQDQSSESDAGTGEGILLHVGGAFTEPSAHRTREESPDLQVEPRNPAEPEAPLQPESTSQSGRRRKMGSSRRSLGRPAQENPAEGTAELGRTSATDAEGGDAEVLEEQRTSAHLPQVSRPTSSQADERNPKPSATLGAPGTGEPLGPNRTREEEPGASMEPWRDHLQKNLYLGSGGYNVVMVGDSGVGKTSFMRRAQTGKFSLHLSASVGLDTCMWTVMVDGRPVVLHLWDTAGQERFHSITRQIFHKAQAFLLMYDVSSSQSFAAVRYWADCIREGAAEDVAVLLLGNKMDRADRRVKIQDGERLAQEHGLDFLECSAATGDNVIQSLEMVARLLNQRPTRGQEVLLAPRRPQKSSSCC